MSTLLLTLTLVNIAIITVNIIVIFVLALALNERREPEEEIDDPLAPEDARVLDMLAEDQAMMRRQG